MCDVGGDQPSADEEQADPRHLHDRHLSESRGDENRNAGEPVAQSPYDGVDERLHGHRAVGRHREVEELHRRLIDRIPQDLVDASEHDHRCQRADDEEANRSEEQADRHDEERETEAQATQQAAGEQPLQGECQHAGVEVELAEERRERVFPVDCGSRQRLELPPGHRRSERGQQNDGRDRDEIRRLSDQLYARTNPASQLAARAGGFRFAVRNRPMAPQAPDDTRSRHEAEGHPDQRELGAVAGRDFLRQVPADDPARGRAAPDEAIHPLGLAGGKDRGRQRPNLSRRHHAEHANPDVDDRRQPGRPEAVGKHPENQAVESKEQQAADEELTEGKAARQTQVHRDPEADQRGDADIGVRQQECPECVDEQRIANRLADDETGNDQKEIGEKEQPPLQLSRPEIEESFEPLQHGSGTGVYPD